MNKNEEKALKLDDIRKLISERTRLVAQIKNIDAAIDALLLHDVVEEGVIVEDHSM